MASSTTSWPVFGFETDLSGSLRCIPMCVRFKLDMCGVKLTLKQWNRFIHEERERLVLEDCDTPEHVEAYRAGLVALIEGRAASAAEPVAAAANSPWNDAGQVPMRIIDYATGLDLQPPSPEQWAMLTPLQRFALFKLTSPGHANDNFVPAMQEFGLMGQRRARNFVRSQANYIVLVNNGR